MREIKFRAKDVETGKWLFGDLLTPRDKDGFYEISDANSLQGFVHEIDEKTIGEYTGKKDINGCEIYEGDILQDNIDDACCGVVKYDPEGACFYITALDVYILGEEFDSFRVIGNIYDDPKFFEVDHE